MFISDNTNYYCENIDDLLESVLSNLQFLDILSDKRDKIQNIIQTEIKNFTILSATSAIKMYKKELKEIRKNIEE